MQTATATEIPPYILPAILKVETKSYFDERGAIIYVERKDGLAGEYGPYQVTKAAFDQIYKGRRPRSDLKKDMQFATMITTLYLLWLHKHYGKGDWNKTIQYYNAGPLNNSPIYLQKIHETYP